MIETMEPIRLEDLKKGLVVPEEDFEQFLQRFDWTWHQIAREEFPAPFRGLDEFQLACICADPVLWCSAFLRDPDDPEKPWEFWDYQKESARYYGNTLHECGAEVGKTRGIIGHALHKAYTVERGGGLITAPMAIHYIEIIDAINEQLSYNKDLKKARILYRKHPHHHMRWSNGFTIDFRPTGYDGEALRAVHVPTFAIMDESSKAKNPTIFKEFWRAGKPGCNFKLYSVPDGDRSTVFYKLCQKAEGKLDEKEEIDALTIRRDLEFKKFHWSKELMPAPFWTPERRRFYIDTFGGEDSPGYQQNVLGNWGDPENSVFPWYQFARVLKDIPEYRCLKILVDESHGEVSLFGTQYSTPPDAPSYERRDSGGAVKPQEQIICDRRISKRSEEHTSELQSH